MGLHGRKIIRIPEDNMTIDTFEKYLPTIMSIYLTNKSDIDKLNEYYVGLQDIRYKEKETRPSINNKSVENHAFEITEFWKGYMVGRPISYAQRSVDELTDDISMLNKYMASEGKAAKDTQIWQWLALCGQAFYLCLPKTKDEQVEDLEKEAPYKIIAVPPDSCECIYSSYVGHKKIGAVIITDLSADMVRKTCKYQVTLWTKEKRYDAICNLTGKKVESIEEKNVLFPYIPLIEYKLNENRIGIVETVKDMLDVLNFITSNELDDVQQFVNSIMIFKNSNITKELLEDMQAMKIIKINSPNPATPSDVSVLQQTLNHADVDVLYERVYTRMLGIIATPKSSDRASSGGDTGQARLLGEGWTLADQRANSFQNMLSESEQELLKLSLYICRNIPECKIDKLYPSDVEVKYSRSKSDNMLVKSQVILNLQAAGLPEDIITQTCELFGDDIEVANSWKANLEKKKQEEEAKMEQQMMQKTVNNQDNRTKQNQDKE